MNVLIACEESGTVRDAFIRRGHNAISCDILETSSPGPHVVGDVKHLLKMKWDLIIAHPPCTYLCNSGVCWLYKKIPSGTGWPNPVKFTKERNEERWEQMREGAEFFNLFMQADCERIAIENPIMHKYAVEIIGRRQDQVIQPWQFGHGETKATCLWLKGLLKLKPSNIVEGREQRLHLLPPSKDRAKIRSKTFQGIADAMADQWG